MVQDITLSNVVLETNLPLSMVDTEYYILDKVDWGAIQASHQQYKYIGQKGVTIVGHTLGTRDIEIKGWIIAKTEQEMTERKMLLNRFFNPLQLITLYYSDYSIDFYCQNTIKYGTENKENNEVICHWVVDGIAPDPYFKKVKDNTYIASGVDGMFIFPLTIKDNKIDSLVFGGHKKTTIFDAYNSGHIPTGFKVTFYARSGIVKNPKLIHINKQQYIQINKTLYTGESVEIDTNRGNRTVYGIYQDVRQNYFMYKDLGSSWIELDVGKNEMNYTAEEGMDMLDVIIDLNYKYQEVQQCY